jgi:hypothetical protein
MKVTELRGRVVIILLHIWDVRGSNLVLETGFPYPGFRTFAQSLQANTSIVL